MGGSYGGYMTMAAITEHPELWSAAVNIVGIVNFVTFLERTGASGEPCARPSTAPSSAIARSSSDISPIHKVDRITCPLMLVHGANDPRVPVGEAEQVRGGVAGRGTRGDVSTLRG